MLLVQSHVHMHWARVFSCNLPGNHASVYSVISLKPHIPWVHVCLAVSCQLQFWQPDQDLLLATAVTWGWNRYRWESAQSWFWRGHFPTAAAGKQTCGLSVMSLVIYRWPISHPHLLYCCVGQWLYLVHHMHFISQPDVECIKDNVYQDSVVLLEKVGADFSHLTWTKQAFLIYWVRQHVFLKFFANNSRNTT